MPCCRAKDLDNKDKISTVYIGAIPYYLMVKVYKELLERTCLSKCMMVIV
jgi:hypothetical protein